METFFWFIGLVFFLYQSARFVLWIYLNFFRQNDLSAYRKGKKEPWALVTGATDGIGKAYAQELAKRKFNILLLSRTQEKLDAVKEEISNQYSVKVDTIAVDAAQATEETYVEILKKVENLELSVLINNVGLSHLPNNLEDVKYEEIDNIIKVNCIFSLRITQTLLPLLKKNKQGAIVNLSSISGSSPTPFLTAYAASKAFNRNFSESLALECKEFGIDVQSVDPSFVISNMSRMKRESFTVCSARRCANDSLRKLPFTSVTPYWVHGMMEWGQRQLPKFVYDKMMLDMFKALRRKAEARGVYKKTE